MAAVETDTLQHDNIGCSCSCTAKSNAHMQSSRAQQCEERKITTQNQSIVKTPTLIIIYRGKRHWYTYKGSMPARIISMYSFLSTLLVLSLQFSLGCHDKMMSQHACKQEVLKPARVCSYNGSGSDSYHLVRKDTKIHSRSN